MSQRTAEKLVREQSHIDAAVGWVKETLQKTVPGGPVQITMGRENKSRLQEKCYHALIGDFAKQVVLPSGRYDAETWKALLVHEFEKEMLEMGEPISHGGYWVPSLKGMEMIRVRPSTTRFKKKEASDFIEWLRVIGEQYGVYFTDYALRAYNEYKEANYG